MQPTKFSAWLEKQYINWLTQAGERRTQREFAAWLGISNALLSHYLRGSRNPTSDFLEKIAVRLGDEVYDVVALARPDILFRRLKHSWAHLTSEERKQIENIVDHAEERL